MSKIEISQEMLRKIWIECEEEIVEMLQKKMEGVLEERGKQKFKVGVPEIEELIGRYYVDSEGYIDFISHHDIEDGATTETDYKNAYINGMIFNSREEAEQYSKERLLLFKIKKWAETQNGDWMPDATEIKHYIYYDNDDNLLSVESTYYYNYFSKLPYFKTEKIAQACIDEFGDEILEVLVNESN